MTTTTMAAAEEKKWTVKTKEESNAYKAEVERLKELWYDDVREPTTREALANLREAYESTNGFAALTKENKERASPSDKLKKARLRKFELENKNLEWPKPAGRHFVIRKSEDYWNLGGCMYCGYMPKTTHDYEVHIVTIHPGKPAYPGPADLEKYRQLQKDGKSKVVDMAEADSSGNGLLENA